MYHSALRLFAATALSLSLAACVDPTLTGASAAAPAAPAPVVKTDDLPADAKLIEGVYSAKNDTQFDVPAVPVEKVPAEFQRQTVAFESDQPVGTIIINPSQKLLYLVTGKNKAVRYGISVGKAGFQWSGEALITGRKEWPTWTPPKEMIARKPELEKWKDGQPGGPTNPLGARALYLTTNGVDYGYRIHGTPEWNSIGRNASSGCIRMINQDVMDLFERVPDGTKVVVLNADGSMPKGLTLPPPQPVAAKPKPKATAKPKSTAPAAATPAIVVPKPAVMPTPVITTGAAAVATPAATTPAPAAVTPAPMPALKPAPAPAITQPSVACKVPLVNGICPAT
jgi:lipoprotein-anchoring transpeptidase ErfK/SrfK